MDCCIICQQYKKENLVCNPSLDSLDKLLLRTRKRAEYKDTFVADFNERTLNCTAQQLLNNKVKYHKSCYSSSTNAEKVERAKKRYRESIESGQCSIVKRKAGRPSLKPNKIKDIKETLTTRSKTVHYDKMLCIICQKKGGKLHLVQTKETGSLMLTVSEKLLDKSFFRRLNNITSAFDAVANDVKYHNLCWADAKKKATPKVEQAENYSRALADVEIIDFVENCLRDQSLMLDMNKVDETYKEILTENGTDAENLSTNYKKHLKSLILENVEGAVFVKPQNRNKPEQIIADSTQSEVISQLVDEGPTEGDLKIMWNVAKEIRKDILKRGWKFEGELHNFEASQLLQTFLKWVLVGPHKRNRPNHCTAQIESLMTVITQLVVQSVKTPKQANYQLSNENSKTYNTIETPLNVGLGLYVYHSTRSKKLVKFLSDLNLSITYDKVIEIKKGIVTSIMKRRAENDGVFVPSSLSQNIPVFFAIDNTDLKIDTVDGKSQLHGTAIAVYQQQESKQTKVCKF